MPRTLANKRGFTLIEMMVVIALIALIFGVALPRVSSIFRVSIRSTLREMASVIKETYNATIVTGRVHRVVYDLENNSYWVEAGPKGYLLHTEETLEKEERAERFKTESERAKNKKKDFVMEKTITRKKTSLPSGVKFDDVFTQKEAEGISEGLAYTHMFPHGVTEQTIIHLVDLNNHKVSLVISPFIGKTKVINRYVEKDEVFK